MYQGILISGNNTTKSATENSQVVLTSSCGRSVTAIPALNLASGQENRGPTTEPFLSTTKRTRSKSPGNLLKSQLISPRFSVPKPDPVLISSNSKKMIQTTNPRENNSLNRRESFTNLKFKAAFSTNPKPSAVTNNRSSNCRTSSGSDQSNINSTDIRDSSSTITANQRTSSFSNNGNTTNSITNITTNIKPVLRSNSSFIQTKSFKKDVPLKRCSSNQPSRSPPPLSQDQKKNQKAVHLSSADTPSPTLTPRATGKDIKSQPSTTVIIFPAAPENPEKQFTGGIDKIAYKIWTKERAKYDKWESSKKLFQTKLVEGNFSACQRIVDRLNSELEELTKSIREDECRRIFPEEPEKPVEYCPGTVKEARIWYQQKVVYEAWDNAFKLFQENVAKGDTTACKKLIDAIQMTIYNPQYKSELLSTQPNSSRRNPSETNFNLAPLTSRLVTEEDLPEVSKQLQVKFAVDPPISISPNPTNTNNQTTIPKIRPKLQPPASWTRPRNRESQSKKNFEKTNLKSHVDIAVEDLVEIPDVGLDESNRYHVQGFPDRLDENCNVTMKGNSITSISSDLIDAIDSVLAELDSNTFFNPPPN